MKKLTEKVAHILEKFPKARDDDRTLVLYLWYVFYRQHIQVIEGEPWIRMQDVKLIPTFESVTRCRRKFQEQGLYPASPEAQGRRKRREEAIHGGINAPDWGQVFP